MRILSRGKNEESVCYIEDFTPKVYDILVWVVGNEIRFLKDSYYHSLTRRKYQIGWVSICRKRE